MLNIFIFLNTGKILNICKSNCSFFQHEQINPGEITTSACKKNDLSKYFDLCLVLPIGNKELPAYENIQDCELNAKKSQTFDIVPQRIEFKPLYLLSI